VRRFFVTRPSALLVALLLIAGCGRSPTAPWSGRYLTTAAELTAVRGAPEEVRPGGLPLRLAAYLWRDFMPVSPPNGEPLAMVLRVAALDATPFPADLAVDVAWVLKGPRVWATRVEEISRPAGAPAIEVRAARGPRWDPGTVVDVVVRLRDAKGGVWYLAVKGQTIQATR
jgi:hypothetical protein